jgi:hypothetical protein
LLGGENLQGQKDGKFPPISFLHVRKLNVTGMDVVFDMKMEGTQLEDAVDEMHFDAHEFDGLREEMAIAANTWLKQADRFVRANPWISVIGAAALACAVTYAVSRPRERKLAE